MKRAHRGPWLHGLRVLLACLFLGAGAGAIRDRAEAAEIAAQAPRPAAQAPGSATWAQASRVAHAAFGAAQVPVGALAHLAVMPSGRGPDAALCPRYLAHCALLL